MKAAIAFAAASAAVAHAVATPAQLDDKPSKRSSGSLPAVTVKGNGMFRRLQTVRDPWLIANSILRR